MRLVPGARASAAAREAYFGTTHGVLRTPVIDRQDLDATPRLGPLLVDEYDATTLVPPGASAHLDGHGNIVIHTGARHDRAPFERRLRRRNHSWGEASEGGQRPPPNSMTCPPAS